MIPRMKTPTLHKVHYKIYVINLRQQIDESPNDTVHTQIKNSVRCGPISKKPINNYNNQIMMILFSILSKVVLLKR